MLRVTNPFFTFVVKKETTRHQNVLMSTKAAEAVYAKVKEDMMALMKEDGVALDAFLVQWREKYDELLHVDVDVAAKPIKSQVLAVKTEYATPRLEDDSDTESDLDMDMDEYLVDDSAPTHYMVAVVESVKKPAYHGPFESQADRQAHQDRMLVKFGHGILHINGYDYAFRECHAEWKTSVVS